MMDVDVAVKWSAQTLKTDGLFAMQDYVGPNRFQWTNRNLDFVERVRRSLPESLLMDPLNGGQTLPFRLQRPDPDAIAAFDPTEAPDSERILDAIDKYFLAPEIIPTGGTLYHFGLKDILANFTQSEIPILAQILNVDAALATAGETHYAAAFCWKL